MHLIFCFLAFATVQAVAIGLHETHETKDTITPIESNFGTLKIKPVYSNNMGKRAPWKLTIDNENKLLL